MKRGTWMMMGACVMVGVAAFLATVKGAPSASGAAGSAPLPRWLALSAQQQREISLIDSTFDADSAALRAGVFEARSVLAEMLEMPDATEAEVLAQVDRVSAEENALQRRVTQYVLRIRHQLTPEQRQNLTGLCANALRGQGRGQGMGRGMGRGQGMGGGNGRGYRGGRGGQ